MFNKKTQFHKAVSLISGLSLLLQSFTPLFLFPLVTTPVIAEEPAGTSQDNSQSDASGTTGVIGDTGTTGTTGTSDAGGATGPSGASATTAQSPETGPSGATGTTGEAPETGPTGSSGLMEAVDTNISTPSGEQGQILDGVQTSVWTFESVELNREYAAPQNSGVKLTFTKLPTPSGNIKIEEITLTKEQVEQTGSLSDKAYDITSDMPDGSFAYNLTLPIPESKKGQPVEVKLAEAISEIGSAQKVENTLTTTNASVSVNNLDHFTIFVVVNSSPPPSNYLQDIIDNTDPGFQILSGTWRTSTSVPGYLGTHYITTDDHAGVGQVRWNFTPTQSGIQEIFTRWTALSNRGTAVPFTVTHDGGATTVSVNQELNNGTWMTLGTYSFTAGTSYSVTLTNNSTNANDYVIGDAIKLQNVFDPSEVWVDDGWTGTPVGTDLGSGKIFGFSAFTTIQEAIAAVAADGTVNIAAGIYTETNQIVIDKNLSIIGADKITTIIKPAQNTGFGTHQDINAWILVNSGVTFNLSHVTLDGAGKLINHGILSHGHGTIDNNIITNIAYNQSGPNYMGIGIELYGSDMTVSNNTLSNIGRIGVYTGFGSTTTITGNTYVGKGVGNFLDYGFEVGRNGQATIENNTISNNKGVASDGSTSAGILATTYYAPGTTVTIVNNSIHDNSYGVALGYSGDDTTSVPQFDANTFSNNTFDLDNHTVTNIDARNNIWSVADQDNLDQIETKINHYCLGSLYVHGICSGTDDYGVGFGSVRYKNIGTLNNLGWNVRSQSTTPNETPLDLACPVNTVYTNENSVAQNWSKVNGANVRYQRKVVYPSSSIGYFEAGSNTYTPFVTFGSAAGIEGLWKTSVRAYADADNDNRYDIGEEVSDWSNECKITLDKTLPSAPGITNPNAEQYFNTQPILNKWTTVSDSSGISYYRVEYEYDDHHTFSGYPYRTTTTNQRNHTPALSEQGGVRFRVQAFDNAGNEGAWSEWRHYFYDATPPGAPTLLSPTNNAFVQGFPSLTNSWSSVPDAIKYIYESYNNSSATSLRYHGEYTTTSKTANNVANAIFWWRVRAIDAANNIGLWSDLWKVTVDNTKPQSFITTPTNPGSGSTIYVTSWSGAILGTATDALSGVDTVNISIENGSGEYFDGTSFVTSGSELLLATTYSGGNWEYSGLTSPLEGSYTIRSHAMDNAGNIENTYSVTVILDHTIPEVSITLNPATPDGSNDWYKTQPEATLTASDPNIDQIEYQWNSQTGTWTTYSAPFKPGSEGTHVLYYRARDLAGNYSDVGIKNIKWDKTPLEKGPQNLSVSPNPSNGNNVKVSWESAVDNAGIHHYTVSWKKEGVGEQGTDVSESTRQYTILDTLTEGSWTIRVTAHDNAGFSSDASVTATVDLTGPVAPTLTLTGTGLGSVSLTWNAVDGAVDYSVWYGTQAGNYAYAAHVGNVTSYTIQGLGTGTYYVVVAAYDSVMNRSAYSNEVNTGTAIGGISGATGPAAGFQPAGEVFGVNTEEPTPTPTTATGDALGSAAVQSSQPGAFPWMYILLGFPVGFIFYLLFRQRKNQ